MTIKNKFANYAATPTGASTDLHRVTPSDTEELPFVSRMIYVGVAGDVEIVSLDQRDSGISQIVTFPAGSTMMLCAVKIKAAGTTADSIIVLS